MATELKCEVDGCNWTSPSGSLDTVVKLLDIHVNSKHFLGQKCTQSKPEKAKRPEIGAELSDEDWIYFVSRWNAYKKATNLSGADITLQLLECCCEELRRNHHRNYPAEQQVSEESLLAQIKKIAVRIKNRAVNRVKLNTLKQDKGEPIRRFAGRIRSLATVSEYAVKCGSCKTEVSYTDEVIKDQVISGIADHEIQKDVLSHEKIKDLSLESLLIFIEGKEAGHTSLNLMSGQTIPEVSKVETKEKKCRYCGEVHILGKKKTVKLLARGVTNVRRLDTFRKSAEARKNSKMINPPKLKLKPMQYRRRVTGPVLCRHPMADAL